MGWCCLASPTPYINLGGRKSFNIGVNWDKYLLPPAPENELWNHFVSTAKHSPKAATNSSSMASLWAGPGVIRNRSLPFGTVG